MLSVGSSTSGAVLFTKTSSVGRIPRPYDLTWPIKNRTEVKGSVVEDVAVRRKVKPGTGSLEELKGYAERLVGAIPDPSTNGVKIKIPAEMVDEADREWRRRYSSSHTDDDVGGGGLSGCREAVEILTRNPKKGMRGVLNSSCTDFVSFI